MFTSINIKNNPLLAGSSLVGFLLFGLLIHINNNQLQNDPTNAFSLLLSIIIVSLIFTVSFYKFTEIVTNK